MWATGLSGRRLRSWRILRAEVLSLGDRVWRLASGEDHGGFRTCGPVEGGECDLSAGLLNDTVGRMELVFSVTQEGDGGYVAECLSHDIFTQGDTWAELRANVSEAVTAYFFDQPKPAANRCIWSGTM